MSKSAGLDMDKGFLPVIYSLTKGRGDLSMHCKNCGAQIPGDSKFCKACGTKQAAQMSYATTAPPEEMKKVSSPPPFKSQKKKRSPGKIVLRVFGIFFFLTGIIVALIYLTGQQASEFRENLPAVLFCWGIGIILIGISFRKKPLPGIVPQKQANGGSTLCVILGILFVMAGIVNSVAEQAPKAKTTASGETSSSVIADATKFAGKPLEEIETLAGPLLDNGGISLTTVSGETVEGETYSPQGSATQFIFYEGKCVKYQYISDNDIPYEKKEDIFAMFGISPQKDMSLVADTNFAMRYLNVTDSISEFYVQIMDSRAKTFSAVKVTYDSNFAVK